MIKQHHNLIKISSPSDILRHPSKTNGHLLERAKLSRGSGAGSQLAGADQVHVPPDGSLGPPPRGGLLLDFAEGLCLEGVPACRGVGDVFLRRACGVGQCNVRFFVFAFWF